MLLYSPPVPREGAPVLGRFLLQLPQRSTRGFRCAEGSCSSCLSTAHACATAHVAHAGRTYLMVVVRLPCTGSQHTVNAVTNAGNGCRCSAAASLAIWVVMPRCCVRPWCAVCTSVCVHVYIRSPQAADVETV